MVSDQRILPWLERLRAEGFALDHPGDLAALACEVGDEAAQAPSAAPSSPRSRSAPAGARMPASGRRASPQACT